jgi:ABC-2 type transport system ATP-binding protein
MTIALSVTALTKVYRSGIVGCAGNVEALRGMELAVEEGELLGLLGPNGAGKSTLLLCAAGLLKADSGNVSWFGSPDWPGGRPPGIAYAPERSMYHRFLTVRETLEFCATLHELSAKDRTRRVDEALERVDLVLHAGKRVSQLSRGMVQRLSIAQALIGRPRLLLLDETLSGLDPVGARDVRVLLRALRDEGTTILLSSHDLLALEHIASRVVVMKDGRSHATFDPATLTGGRWLVLVTEGPALAVRLLSARHAAAVRDGDEVHIPLGTKSPEDILADCVSLGIEVRASRVRRDDLEQRFFDLIEQPSRVAEADA